MTSAVQHHDLGHGISDAFSPEPEKRTVELAFLQRLNSAAASAAASILGAAKKPKEASFQSDFAFVRSPVFATTARALEKSVPEDADFGPFRGR